jgi:hypothetical protein
MTLFNPQPKPSKREKQDKTGEWHTILHKEIVPQFKAWGITMCEIGLTPCLHSHYLGFAHTKKRRNIKTPQDLRRVVLACEPCHAVVEYHCRETTGQSMTEYLEGIIKKRKV